MSATKPICLHCGSHRVVGALAACVANHCGDSKMFCSTCTPARALMLEIAGDTSGFLFLNDLMHAVEMAAEHSESGSGGAMADILMSLYQPHYTVSFTRAFTKLDRSNQRIALRLINAAVLNEPYAFDWDVFNGAMKPVLKTSYAGSK